MWKKLQNPFLFPMLICILSVLYFTLLIFSLSLFLLWFDDFLLQYGSVFFGLCTSIIHFWFVVTLFFKCVNPLCVLPFEWLPYNLKHIPKKIYIFLLTSPHFMIFMSSCTSSCLSFCYSLWLSSLSQNLVSNLISNYDFFLSCIFLLPFYL